MVPNVSLLGILACMEPKLCSKPIFSHKPLLQPTDTKQMESKCLLNNGKFAASFRPTIQISRKKTEDTS